MSEFSNESAFKQAVRIADQIKINEGSEGLDEVIARAERITAAMEIDLNSIYDSLNVVLNMIDDPSAIRAIEDIRDEIYRCMR